MILKNLSIVFVISATTLFSGCSLCEKKVYIDRPVPYAVPVPCEVPKVSCNWDYNGSEPIVKLLECVVEQKKAMQVCQENK